MLATFAILTSLCGFQDSRPASQPMGKPARSGAERTVERLPGTWGDDAPGQWAVRDRKKFAPITKAPYCSAKAAAKRVSDADIVIGIRLGKKAIAYPIKMLGGPHREIINERLAGEPFAVNW